MRERVIANPIQRLFEIGRFFENLTLSTVGGKRSSEKYKKADIEHPKLNAWIECKAMGSSERPSVEQHQFEKHLRTRGFPYDHCLYALWVYRNTRQRRIGTETATVKELRHVLSQRVESLYLLDIRVLAAVRDKYGVITRYSASHVPDVIKFGTTLLRRFAQSPRNFLQEIGLKPGDYSIRQEVLRTAVLGCPIRCRATSILPRLSKGYSWPIHQRYRWRHK